MKRNILTLVLTVGTLAGLGVAGTAHAQSDGEKMSFFITSVGMGKGGDLGGLTGADGHCASLAKAAGSTRTDWKAYLSTSMMVDRSGGRPYKITSGINARDRIGHGPWHNANGVLIAENLDDLHSSGNKINLANGLDEKGNPVNGRGQKPNRHDILTGSDPQGLFSTAGGDTTCGNWTKSGQGSAIVGHHDRVGLNKDRNMVSWNSAHGSRGCGEADLPKSGGAGLFYCFAAK